MTIKTIADLKTSINTDIADNTTGDISALDIRQNMIDTVDSLLSISGWVSYIDTQYPDSGSALTVSASTDTALPNNAGTKIETYKPLDITQFYTPNSLFYDNGSSSFTIGETITGGTSGATATIIDIAGNSTSGMLYIDNVSGTFANNEALTDGATGSALVNGTLDGGKIIGREGDSLDCMIFFKAVPSAANQWLDIWVDIQGAVGELYRQTFTFPKGASVERGILYALPSAYTLNTWEENGAKVYVRSDASVDIYGINFNFDRCFRAG